MGKNSLGGVMNPPTPWMGSAMSAAMRPFVVVWIISSMSCAHFTSHDGYVKPERAAVAVRVHRVLHARHALAPVPPRGLRR